MNWERYLENYDFIWEGRENLPLSWSEGAYHGNGTLGSLVYFRMDEKGFPTVHLELGNNRVYDRRETRNFWMAKQFDNPRLSIGSLEYDCGGNILDFWMRTSLYHGSTELYLKTEKELLHCIFYVCAANQMIVIEQKEGRLSHWKFIPAQAVSPRQTFGIQNGEKERIDADYRINPDPEICIETDGISCIQALDHNWKTVTVCRYEKARGNIYVKIQQEKELSINQVKDDLNQDMGMDFKGKHLNWWHSYYPVSSLHIPDKELEAFYWRQIYKLGSAVREDSAVLDNQGPWLFATPWPGTWWNLNVQLCYWPLYTSNRLKQGRSLNNWMIEHQNDLIENVPEKYRYDSSGMGTNTTFNLRSQIADPTADNGRQFVELGNLTWVLHNCWLYYRMSMDKTVLKELIYPILKRSVNYYLHFVEKDETGTYHLPASDSPEYGERCEDCNYDLSLLRWGCETLLECTAILQVQDEKEEVWKSICKNLADYPRDETGYLIGKNLPYQKSHRHFSHLMMHMPLYLVNRDNSDTRELAERSLKHWFSYQGDILGFSYVGASLICSAYKLGTQAARNIKDLIKNHISYTTMYQEAGPVMETPLAAAECIQQLLLQSWGGKIRVFPAMPDDWHCAEFHRFAAQGGFVVSADYHDGSTAIIEVESLAGQPCIVETDMEAAEILYDDGRKEEKSVMRCLSLDLKKGGKVKILRR